MPAHMVYLIYKLQTQSMKIHVRNLEERGRYADDEERKGTGLF